jgi:hippurate hydrolase
MDTNNAISGLTEKITDELIQIRRTIHQNPELGFEEFETAKLVSEALDKMGILQRTGVGGTGVIGIIEGANPGKTIAIRADLDALPIDEQSGVSFASKVPGKMHACGHDAHTSIALGTAMVLNQMKDQLKGRVKLIFQPNEEGLGGAKAMIEDGVLEDPAIDIILGYHNWPLLEAGKVGYQGGAVFAASDFFDVTLKGVSGHAAHPHTTVDTIAAAAFFITQLQTIVSREIAPVDPTVVSVGKIEGGTARNIIAGEVCLSGGIRGQSTEVMKRVEETMRRLLDGIKAGMRVDYELDYRVAVPVLRNDLEVLDQVLVSARKILGEENVEALDYSSMGSEDLAFFTERLPSAHLRIGSKIDGLDTMLHKANYDCNEEAIPTGVRAISQAALDLLA